MTFRSFTPLLSIAGQGKEFTLLGLCYCGSSLHEHGFKQQSHEARDKMGKKVKGETLVLPGDIRRLKPNTELGLG